MCEIDRKIFDPAELDGLWLSEPGTATAESLCLDPGDTGLVGTTRPVDGDTRNT